MPNPISKTKPQYYDAICEKLLALESFTDRELDIFDQVYSKIKSMPEAVNETATAALLHKSLAASKDELKISPKLEAKIKAHIDFMGSLLIGFGSVPNFFGLAGLAFNQLNCAEVGAEEIEPFIAKCLPDDMNALKAIYAKLDLEEFASLFNDAVYSMFAHSIATIQLVCMKKLNPLSDEIDPNETAEEKKEREKKAKKLKIVDDAVKLAAEEEQYLLAIAQLQHTNAEFLQGLRHEIIENVGNVENIEEFIITELKKENVWDLYDTKALHMNETKNEHGVTTKTSNEYINKPVRVILMEIHADYENQNRFITSTLNQNKKLLRALYQFHQYATVKEIEQTLGKPDLTAKQTVDHVDNVLKNNAVYFKNREEVNKENKESNATKFFKRMAEIVTFGLAKKLWTKPTKPKEATGEKFIQQTTLFSSPKEKSVGKADETDVPTVKPTH